MNSVIAKDIEAKLERSRNEIQKVVGLLNRINTHLDKGEYEEASSVSRLIVQTFAIAENEFQRKHKSLTYEEWK